MKVWKVKYFKDSPSLSFIIDNRSLTGFAEYLVWQQRNQVNGLIISDFHHSFPSSSSVLIKSQINSNHPRVHLYFSDVSHLPVDLEINRRYTEQYTKHQFLLACHNALIRINEGGHFVCKLLDTLTRFTAGLIYLLYHSFKSIAILRPFTVDPASPTRFLVCQFLKYPVNVSIVQHLANLIKYEKHENILEVVPLKCLIETEFQQYLADTSQRLIQREVQALNKRLYFIEQKNTQQVCHQIQL
ncbi:Cap-specific mRNA (nucleoside-2'-O-)-methyltransferase 1 [Dictyocoela muelleri]|nr:Cap-specific mRNA (nucleoside-2'-O-)-methyltransferase 1 [Dictyocoela muelleri]